MKKKLLSLLLATVLVLTALFGLSAGAEDNTRTVSVYSGTPDEDFWLDIMMGDPCEVVIETADQLMGFALVSNYFNFSGFTIKLGADMVINTGDASEWSDPAKAPEHLWTASSTWDYIFDGNFDGQGHIISGLYVNRNNYAGFFGYVQAERGTEHYIKNFSIINSYYETTTTSGNNRSGGVVAAIGCWNNNPSDWTIENVYVDADMNCASGGTTAGGILGSLQGVGITVKNCSFNGYIKCLDKVGGITGSIEGGSVTIENCEVNTDITVTNERSGGIIGYITNDATVAVKKCNSNADITLAPDPSTNQINDWGAKSGLLVGYMSGTSTLTVNDCRIGGTITDANKHSSGLIGQIKTDATIPNITMDNILIVAPSTDMGALIARVKEISATTNITFALSDIKYDSTVWNDTTLPNIDKDEVGTVTGTDFTAAGVATAELKGVSVFDGWTAVTGDYPVPAVVDLLPDINIDNYINGVAVAPPANDNTNNNTNNDNTNNNTDNNTDNGNTNTNTETKAPETSAPETSAPETSAPATEAPADEKGGCGSTVGIASVALLTVVSAAGVTFSKKRTKK